MSATSDANGHDDSAKPDKNLDDVLAALLGRTDDELGLVARLFRDSFPEEHRFNAACRLYEMLTVDPEGWEAVEVSFFFFQFSAWVKNRKKKKKGNGNGKKKIENWSNSTYA